MQQKTISPPFPLWLILTALLWLAIVGPAAAQYQLRYQFDGKDSAFTPQALQLQTSFSNRSICAQYVNKLPSILMLKGYAAAAIDAIAYDSSEGKVQVYLGAQQNWSQLKMVGIEKKALDEIGFNEQYFSNKAFNQVQLAALKEQIIHFYENNGYPFAAVFLDNIVVQYKSISATLKVDKGPLYHIDSIRVNGKIKIVPSFLQRYLGILNSSLYNKEKLQQVSKRLLDLPYLSEQQPSELLMLGNGAILDLYLAPKRSSQINFLIGVLPAATASDKLRLTGDVNLNLKNTLGRGETILFNWQQLQQKSPRLNMGFQQPYIFNSPFGIDGQFQIFKKDSAFVQLNAQLGLQYLLSTNQSGKLFIQQQSTFLLSSGIDTIQVKAAKKLPVNIDVSSVSMGVDYEFNNTNYRLNPMRGNELKLVSTVGIKTYSKSNDILNLVDPAFNYARLYDSLKLKSFQFRIKAIGAHFFSLGKRSTLKAAGNVGIYNSPLIFRNELFQIGGNQLLRGFDEESIYATQYAVSTAEYRYLIGQNAYLFGFVDAGFVKNKYQRINVSNQFVSMGIGMLFETKLGLLNMSFAIGKRDDVTFNLSSAAKIHFGYINYF